MYLYLLVPSTSPTSRTIEVNGRLWSLQPFDLENSIDGNDVTYSCISYTWGSGREPSPFNSSFPVSDRTVPALQTFIRHRPACSGIWIDAFCVPLTEPERTQTLESMGYIYARANEVLVILSSAAAPALGRMLGSSRLSIADLAVLEHEEWVERAWTYQETVNSKALFLTCEGEASAVVSGEQFFNCLGDALAHGKGSTLDNLHAYPRLNAFEDVMAETYVAAYDRAALNVMSNMDRRVQQRAEDHFYAMIGAISVERSSAIEGLEPSEAFMRICEKKGDFSFIFSAANRDEGPSRRWRPAPGDLPSILPWHSFGTGQPGRLCDDGLWLDSMLIVHPAPPQEETERFAQQWLAARWKDHSYGHQKLEEAMYVKLKTMGFSGSMQCVTTTKGYFFPFEPVTSDLVESIMVSTSISWRMGAPGLVSYNNDHTKKKLYTPGVYVGVVEEKDATSVLLG